MAKASIQQKSAELRACPLPCIRHHRETVVNARGRVTATLCELCGQRVLRSTWLRELLGVAR